MIMVMMVMSKMVIVVIMQMMMLVILEIVVGMVMVMVIIITGCAAAGLHNLVKPAKYRTIPQNREKIVEIVTKEDITITIDHTISRHF